MLSMDDIGCNFLGTCMIIEMEPKILPGHCFNRAWTLGAERHAPRWHLGSSMAAPKNFFRKNFK